MYVCVCVHCVCVRAHHACTFAHVPSLTPSCVEIGPANCTKVCTPTHSQILTASGMRIRRADGHLLCRE